MQRSSNGNTPFLCKYSAYFRSECREHVTCNDVHFSPKQKHFIKSAQNNSRLTYVTFPLPPAVANTGCVLVDYSGLKRRDEQVLFVLFPCHK